MSRNDTYQEFQAERKRVRKLLAKELKRSVSLRKYEQKKDEKEKQEDGKSE